MADEREPDWRALRRISALAEHDVAAGRMNRARWLRLEKAAEEATNGHPKFTEFMALFGPLHES
jgi:hypothetical protein